MIWILFFITLLIVASVIDVKKREIPIYVPIGIAVLSLFNFHPIGILAALPLYIAARLKPENIGGGDIKLVAAAGLFLGFDDCIFGLVTGLTLCIVWHILSGRKSKSLPLAPFLSIGFIITLVGGI